MPATAQLLTAHLKGLRFSPSGPGGAGSPPTAVARGGGESPAARQAWQAGVAHARAGRDAQALPQFQRATQLAPGVALYWLNRSGSERRLRKTDEAIVSARRACMLEPANPLSCQLLAELLRLNNRDAEALRALRALPAEVPRDAQHWLLLGSVQMALRDWQEAAVAFLQVLQQRPADTEAYQQLGFALANLRRFGEAAECFRTITLLDPAAFGAAVYAAHYAAWSCDWSQGEQDHARMVQALALQKDGDESPAFSPFCLLSLDDDAALHLRAARMEAARIARVARDNAGWTPPQPGPAGHPQAAQAVAAGRIRIGFVSADFRMHATSILLVQTLERMDRERFELTLYSHGPDDRSPLRARMVEAVDHFVDCSTMSTVEQAARIREDGIALLVDMSGYTQSSRLSVFALRPAPVQALWLAYPSTTGSDFIDYLIGDPLLTPMAHAEDFSEQLAQLPLTYEPTDERREHPEPLSRDECGLPEDAFVYACFNQSYKITEPVFSRWCRILQQVPGSVLWLLVPQEEIQSALRERAAERGVDPARLIFAPFVSPSQHLARLPQADLFLDTFPYGAHTTCSDALWMGLPVLTQTGRSFSARVAGSLLNAVGLPELAVEDPRDYETLAVRLAEDREALADIRDHLWDQRRDLPLFDNTRFCLEFESLVERIVGHWAAGGSPQAMPAAGVN